MRNGRKVVCLLICVTALGCGTVSLALQPTYQVTPGRPAFITSTVQGELKSIAWTILAATGEECRGTVHPAGGEGATSAEFVAPDSCRSGGENVVQATALFGGSRTVVASTRVMIGPASGSEERSAAAAQRVSKAEEPARQAAEPAATLHVAKAVESEPAAEPPAAMPLSPGDAESTFCFDDGSSGFQAASKRVGGELEVNLSAPSGGGFGGCCVEYMDARNYASSHFLDVELSAQDLGKEFEVKLEKADSSERPYGQRIVWSKPLSARGAQVLHIPIDRVSQDLTGAVKRVCFATTAQKLRGPPRQVRLRVRRISFQ